MGENTKEFDFENAVDLENIYPLKTAPFEKDVISMWVADMEYPVADCIRKAVTARANRAFLGYTTMPEEFFKAVQDYYRKHHDWEFPREHIAFSSGIVQSTAIVINTFTNAGDMVVFQPPIYYPFFSITKENGRRIVENTLVKKGGRYEMDFEDLEEKLQHPRCTLFILCSPHNPVGRVWSKEELRKVADLCEKYDVMCCSDEIHCDLVYPPAKHTPYAHVGSKNYVTLVAPSKSFNIAGLQMSAAVFSARKLRDRYSAAASAVGVHLPSSFGVIGSIVAYREGRPWLEACLKELRGNIDYVLEFFAKNDLRMKPLDPEGTYLLWFESSSLQALLDEKRGGITGEEFFLTEAKVAIEDGMIFGDSGKRFIRMNIATTMSVLTTALERMKSAVDVLLA